MKIIEVVPYNPDWPLSFEIEAGKIKHLYCILTFADLTYCSSSKISFRELTSAKLWQNTFSCKCIALL